MNKLILLLVSVSFFLSSLQAQTPLSGIVNQYSKVLDLDTCAASLSLSAPSGFTKGKRVLVIQMQGATMNETNSANYGTISSMGGSGFYEINTIDSVYGSTVYLRFFLKNNYALGGNVQVVTVPQFADISVTDTLRASPWNGLSGGIIVLESMGSITLNAPIDARGVGFRGGIGVSVLPNSCTWVNPASDYFMGINNWRGTYKGEGVVLSKFGKECGRGAQSNGGGGGNDHNTGGGGGGHLSRGGNGGKNNEPSTFGCQGPNSGLGGKVIPTAANRLLFGGGGGAGHDNNGVGSDGGIGGGIVLLICKTLNTNGFSINANGKSALDAFGDGAGGGGAGGTVALLATSIIGSGSIEAKGGNGGNQVHSGEQRCMGPGGGGAGGRVISAVAVAAILSAGQPGIVKGSGANCNGSNNGAENGTQGIVESSFALVEAKSIKSVLKITKPPQSIVVCDGIPAIFSLETLGKNVQYQWQVNQGFGFVDVNNGLTYMGAKSNQLTVNNYAPAFNGYQFQCIVKDVCGGSAFSVSATMGVSSKPSAGFSAMVTNNNTVVISNFSMLGTSYFWDFGDGTTSTEKSPIHLYKKDGFFKITLTVTNPCGSVTETEDVIIVTPPVAKFGNTKTEGCAPLTVTYYNLSSANTASVLWTFVGGDPQASTDDTVTVVYNIAGTFDVSLLAENTKFADATKFEKLVVIKPQPLPGFDVTILKGQNATFTNTTTYGVTYFWNFGDNATSDLPNPNHKYVKDGTYTVTLVATNDCGSKTIVQKITIVTPPSATFVADTLVGCAPFKVQYKSTISNNTNAIKWTFENGIPAVSMLPNPVVTYGASGTYDVNLVVENVAGKDSIFKNNYVTVKDFPTAIFGIGSVKSKTVTFKNTSVNTTTYVWDFGDKSAISKDKNPTHSYTKSGKYVVKLSATNDCGTNVSEAEVIIENQVACGELGLVFRPNPTYDLATVDFGGDLASGLDYLLSTIDGRILERGTIAKDSSEKEFDLSDLPAGMYVFYFVCEKETFARKVMKY